MKNSLSIGLFSVVLFLSACKTETDMSSHKQKLSQDLFEIGQEYLSAKDCDKAMKLFDAASVLGSFDSMSFQGQLYLGSECFKTDPEKATRYFQESADLGSADGQNNLGVSYLLGTGVKADSKKAVDLFKQSAAQNWSEAQFNLGICYAKGIGIPLDLKIAEDWFSKAQKRGVNGVHSGGIDELSKKILDPAYKIKPATWVRNWSKLGL